jgi:hypothetical protein
MRRTIWAAALAALVVPVAAAARPPAPVSPVAAPLPLGQAQALVADPSAAGGSATREVSPQEAFAAAAAPGAVVAVAPGLSIAEAAGVAHTTAEQATACSANTAWRTWGTWPYEQKLSDTTYWCAVYGSRITYYTSSVNGSGTICGSSWTSSQLISGGIGYSWFVLRSSGGWSCPTAVPWLSLHPSHYIDISRNAWGSTAEVGSN